MDGRRVCPEPSEQRSNDLLRQIISENQGVNGEPDVDVGQGNHNPGRQEDLISKNSKPGTEKKIRAGRTAGLRDKYRKEDVLHCSTLRKMGSWRNNPVTHFPFFAPVFMI